MTITPLIQEQLKTFFVMAAAGSLTESLWQGKWLVQRACRRLLINVCCELAFWAAAAGVTSSFLYYSTFGAVTFHGTAGFFVGAFIVEKNMLWYNRDMGKNRRSREFRNNSQVIDIEEARKRRLEKRRAERAQQELKAQLAAKEKTRGKTAIRRRRTRRRLVMAVIAMFVIAIMGFSLFNVISLKLEQRDVSRQQQELLDEKQRLENELKNINDPENLEEQARNQLRLIKPGETMYLFPDEMTEDGGKAENSTDDEN